MLLTTLAESARYETCHPGLPAAFAFLRDPAHHDLPPGRYPVEGDRLYAIVEQREAVGRERAVLEAHRRYMDVQFTLAGDEVMGWRDLAECRRPKGPFEAERDVGFYEGEPLVWIPVPPGHLAVFFPEDAHAPLAGQGPLRKLIMKVAME